jgi:hypothetical protein
MNRRSAPVGSVHELRSQRCAGSEQRSSDANSAAGRHSTKEQSCDEAVMFHSLVTASN